jgi:hypothetical protein
MADVRIPDELRNFILEQIESVAQIEALLLIRSDTARNWRLEEIARRLYIDEAEAAEVLDGLCTANLLRRSDGIFRLEGIPPHRRSRVEQLLTAYTGNLVSVTKLVHERAALAKTFENRRGNRKA